MCKYVKEGSCSVGMATVLIQDLYLRMGHSSKGKHVYIDFFSPSLEHAAVVVIYVSEMVCV